MIILKSCSRSQFVSSSAAVSSRNQLNLGLADFIAVSITHAHLANSKIPPIELLKSELPIDPWVAECKAWYCIAFKKARDTFLDWPQSLMSIVL